MNMFAEIRHPNGEGGGRGRGGRGGGGVSIFNK